eukprot:TRINITY_DN1829_c0_g1_i1.p1 TRINITY_DN1829_c0_g1~~TRINITY_DN1829_c0_g1_i1.p1  ORF type:complete len:523 (-),score=49.10 TRINITY_DN1829_c0_g1_i1:120-1688(-)
MQRTTNKAFYCTFIAQDIMLCESVVGINTLALRLARIEQMITAGSEVPLMQRLSALQETVDQFDGKQRRFSTFLEKLDKVRHLSYIAPDEQPTEPKCSSHQQETCDADVALLGNLASELSRVQALVDVITLPNLHDAPELLQAAVSTACNLESQYEESVHLQKRIRSIMAQHADVLQLMNHKLLYYDLVLQQLEKPVSSDLWFLSNSEMPDPDTVENSSKLLLHLLAKGDKHGTGTITPAHFRKVLRGCGVNEGIDHVVSAFGNAPSSAPNTPGHGQVAIDYCRFVDMFRASQQQPERQALPLAKAKAPLWQPQDHVLCAPFGTDVLADPTPKSPKSPRRGLASDIACLSQSPWSPQRKDPPASPRRKRPGSAEGQTSLLGAVVQEPRAQTPTGTTRERLPGRRHSFEPGNRNFGARQVLLHADAADSPVALPRDFLGTPRRHVPAPRGDPKRNPTNADTLPPFQLRGRRHSGGAASGVEYSPRPGKARYPSPYRSDAPTDTLGQSGLVYQWWPSREADRAL